jgi:hypothetical protein
MGQAPLSTPIAAAGRIGRYHLIKRLAVGGMADIWLAQELGPRGYERTVVVKTIRADLVDEEDLIHMLVEEARIARCLKHENIVELYEVGEEQNTHYLAMEFVFGRDLRQVRDRCLERGQRIPYAHLVTILADVLDALFYAHHDATFEGRPLRVIHRDVSPQNIIIGFDGSVKLLDFGIAKAAAQLSRTRAGVLKGKYAYMSPEQVDFKEIDQRADVFSVGIVLWEMLTQKRLFYRAGEYETVKAVMACDVPFPRAVRADIPWPLAWVSYRALRRSPRWRYSNAGSMCAALLRWDRRERDVARDQLAQWMGEIFREELRAREDALVRAQKDPARQRQIQDAGFELVDEPTAADKRPRAPSNAREAARLGPLPVRRAEESAPGAGTGVLGMVLSTVSTWKWFIAMFGALVLFGIATGVYIAQWSGAPDEGVGYLSVVARGPGVEVEIGGRHLGAAPLDRVAVLPGRHRVTGSAGGERVSVEVVVTPGGAATVKLELPPKERGRGDPHHDR